MPAVLVVLLLALLGPGVALACKPVPSIPWTKRTEDQRVELSMKRLQPELGSSSPLSLQYRRKGKVLWTTPIEEFVPAEDVLLTRDGSAVLVIRRRLAKFTLYGGTFGNISGFWSFENVLTRSEIQRLPSPCPTREWVRDARVEGDTFIFVSPVEAPVGGARLSRYVTFEVSLMAGMHRYPSLILQTPPELIRMYRQEESLLERVRIADELWTVSRGDRSKMPADLPLFWLEVLRDPKTPRSVLPIAAAGLGASGTDAELRSLSQLPPKAPERDASILRALGERRQEEAGTYAVRILEQQHPLEHVRAAALHHLFTRGGTAEQLGQMFLQKDKTLRDRDTVLLRVAELEVLLAFWQVLPFCTDTSEWVRAGAARSLVSILEDSRKVAALLPDMSDGAESSLKTGCPEALVLLGAIAEKKRDAQRASRLYGLGIEGLEASPFEPLQDTESLLPEAQVRLALLAKEAGNWEDVRRLGTEVLGASYKKALICAPDPVLYKTHLGPGECVKPRTAEAVARQLLREARSQGGKGRNRPQASE